MLLETRCFYFEDSKTDLTDRFHVYLKSYVYDKVFKTIFGPNLSVSAQAEVFGQSHSRIIL